MTFFETMERINRLHYLIKEERTGNPKSLAKRLGIGRTTLYNIIDELKLMEAPIGYSRNRETFYYTNNFDMELHCSIKLIDDEQELKKITGGCKVFSSVRFFWTERCYFCK